MKAFADDTAVVLDEYVSVAPAVAHLFWEFERISALSLNIAKTIFIPLWPVSCFRSLRTAVSDVCPLWKDIELQTYGKYLGFMVGPGSPEHIWSKPLHKYLQRAKEWASLNLGIFYNLMVYRTFISSILSFIMQLGEDPPSLVEDTMSALRLLLSGPGSWITLADASHLKRSYHFPLEFSSLVSLSLACKARVLGTIARDSSSKAKQLQEALITHGRRPFPMWHRQCFFSVLARSECVLQEHGITPPAILRQTGRKGNLSFHSGALQLITQKCEATYYAESRVRPKCSCWKLSGIPGVVERRIVSNMRFLADNAPPRVSVVYFKAVWNGWVTDTRMRSLYMQQGHSIRSCMLLCGQGPDSVQHYAACSVFWQFLVDVVQVPAKWRSRDAFLLVCDSMCPRVKLQVAGACYALHQAVQVLRHKDHSVPLQPGTLLRCWYPRCGCKVG